MKNGAAFIVGAGVVAVAAAALLSDDIRDKVAAFTGRKQEDGGHGHAHGGHGHAHGGHGHSHGGHGHSHSVVSFEDASAWAARFDNAEREELMQPDRIVDEVIKPLMEVVTTAGASSSAPLTPGATTLADIGAGTGFFTLRLARAFPQATVVATDPEPGMRKYLQRRVLDAGLGNVVLVPAGQESPALPRPAEVSLFCTVYHHIEGGEAGRVAYLKAALARSDFAAGGYVVVVDFKPDCDPSISAPPAWMRLDRSQVLAEFEAAGFSLVQAHGFLSNFYVLVFSCP